jgi:AraC family transcriptional regulator
MNQQSSIDEYHYRINLVLEYIQSHIDGDLSIQTLAGVSFFTRFHFSRIFLSLVGETPGNYIRRIRLERAWKMLVYEREIPVADVAIQCGYTSASVFNRAFKTAYAVSPNKIRTTERREHAEKILINGEPISFPPQTNDIIVEVKPLPSFHVAFVRHFGGYNEKIALAFKKLKEWAYSRNIDFSRHLLGVSLDSPIITPDDKCRFLACITVDGNTAPEKGIGVTDLYGGLYAVCPFVGKSKDISSFYNYLFSMWLPYSGYEPVDHPCYYIYVKRPSPEDKGVFYLDLCMPVTQLEYKSNQRS